MRVYRIVSFLIYFMVLFSAYSAEHAESYIIQAYSDHYKILTPARESKKLSVIIENKMLVNLVGRLETKNKKVITFVRVDANDNKAIELKDRSTKDDLFFFPLSPAFQKIELKLGSKSYEIPPKR